MTLPDILASAKDVILAIAAAVTATVAVVGLQSWSRELKGKAAFDIARSLARATYKLRDELSNCRSPFIWAREFSEDYRNAAPPRSAQQEAEGYAQVYSSRWGPVSAAIQEFDAQTLEAEALWGAVIRTRTDQLRQCARELSAAIDATISNVKEGGEDFALDKDFARRIRAAVSALPNESANELSVKIGKAISDIEKELRPHLRRG